MPERINPEGPPHEDSSDKQVEIPEWEAEEGVTPEMERLRREHQIPDSDIEFEDLNRLLDKVGIKEARFTPAPPIIERSPEVVKAEEIMKSEDRALEQRAMERAAKVTLPELVESVKKQGKTINELVQEYRKLLEKSQSPHANERRELLEQLYQEARDAVVPLTDVEQRMERGELNFTQAYEVFLFAEDALKDMLRRIEQIPGRRRTRQSK